MMTGSDTGIVPLPIYRDRDLRQRQETETETQTKTKTKNKNFETASGVALEESKTTSRSDRNASLQIPVLMKPDEITTLKQAASRAGLSIDTIKRLCRKHGISRQSGPSSRMQISRLGLEMVLHDDMPALEALRCGRRGDPLVRRYLDHLGLPE